MTRVCSCGSTYATGTDGRIEHRMKHGHTPSPAVIAHVEPRITYWCRAGKHNQCGGGVVGGEACACACRHEGATW